MDDLISQLRNTQPSTQKDSNSLGKGDSNSHQSANKKAVVDDDETTGGSKNSKDLLSQRENLDQKKSIQNHITVEREIGYTYPNIKEITEDSPLNIQNGEMSAEDILKNINCKNNGKKARSNTSLDENRVYKNTGTQVYVEDGDIGKKLLQEVKEESLCEIHTSQSDAIRDRRFKLDFQLLYDNRTLDFIRISEIKKITEFRIDRPFLALIKSVELFSEGVYLWELCDETGIMHASAFVKEDTVKVGDAVHLVECSIWRFKGNHLNIVYENIKEIYNCDSRS